MAVYGLRHTRSRMAGEITRLEEWNRRNNQKIDDLRNAIASNLKTISTLQEQIDTLGNAAMLGFDRQLPKAVPRRTYAMKHFLEWGGLMRETIRVLRAAQGKSLTSLQIAIEIESFRNLSLCAEQKTHLRVSVGKALTRLRNKEVVKYARKADSPGEYASWVLAVSAE